MSASAIMSVDQSLASTGLAIFPGNWDGQFATVQRKTIGYSLPKNANIRQHVKRLEDISSMARAFAYEFDVQHVGLESPAFGKNTQAHNLGRIFGVLALDFTRQGMTVHNVQLSTARKLFLGTLSKSAKTLVMNQWRQLGAPWKNSDESDAATVGNWLSGHLGGAFYAGMSLYLPGERAAS